MPAPCTGTQLINTQADEVDGKPRCCPWKTWNESLTRALKGDSTWHYWLEHFTRANIWYLTRDGIESANWDVEQNLPNQLSYPEGLVADAEDAIRNFYDIFQPKRWVGNDFGRPTPCYGNPFFWTAEEGALPVPLAAEDAYQRIFGRAATEPEKLAFKSKAWTIIEQVPRRSGGLIQGGTGDLTGWAKQDMPMLPSFTVGWDDNTGVAFPRSWAAAFIEHFRSKSTRVRSVAVRQALAVRRALPVLKRSTGEQRARSSASALPVLSTTDDGEASAKKPGTVSLGTGLLLAAGSLGIVAAGYFYLRSRRARPRVKGHR